MRGSAAEQTDPDGSSTDTSISALAGPGNAHDAIADHGVLQLLQVGVPRFGFAFACQPLQRCAGNARSGQLDRRQLRRPGLAEDADGGPLNAGQIIAPFGGPQSQRIRFARIGSSFATC